MEPNGEEWVKSCCEVKLGTENTESRPQKKGVADMRRTAGNRPFLLVVLTLLSALLSVGAASADAPVEIVLWHQEAAAPRVAAVQEMIDRFNAQNEGKYRVVQAPQTWGEIYPKLYAAIEAGNPPDILFSLPDLTMAMKLTGALTPVEDIVEKVDGLYDLFESQVTPYEYDGHIWAVPMWGMTHVLWFNKGMFEEAGVSYPFKDWDELLEGAKKLTKGGKFGFGFPASQTMMTDQYVYNFMVTNFVEMFDEQGNVTLDSPQAVETFAFIKQLIECSPPDVLTWQMGDRSLYFQSETVAMIMDFPGVQAISDLEKEGRGPFGFMRVPYPEDGRPGSASYSNGASVFAKDPAKLEAVEAFLLFLHEPENNGYWLAAMYPGLYLPITKAAMESESFWSNPYIAEREDDIRLGFEVTEDGLLFGFEHAPQPVIGRVSGENLLGQMAGMVATGMMTPEEVVKWGADQIRAWAEELK